MGSPRWIATVVKSAVATFAATVVLGQPATLRATGPQQAARAQASAEAEQLEAPESAQLGAGESRVDDLEIQSKLVPDPKHAARWLVSMTVTNPTDRQITGRCTLELERYSGNPMARVSPPPATVWTHHEEVEVVAHGTITRNVSLPRVLSRAITKTRKAAEAADAKGIMLPRFVSYEVSAFPAQPKSTKTSKPRSAPRMRATRRAKETRALPNSRIDLLPL